MFRQSTTSAPSSSSICPMGWSSIYVECHVCCSHTGVAQLQRRASHLFIDHQLQQTPRTLVRMLRKQLTDCSPQAPGVHLLQKLAETVHRQSGQLIERLADWCISTSGASANPSQRPARPLRCLSRAWPPRLFLLSLRLSCSDRQASKTPPGLPSVISASCCIAQVKAITYSMKAHPTCRCI